MKDKIFAEYGIDIIEKYTIEYIRSNIVLDYYEDNFEQEGYDEADRKVSECLEYFDKNRDVYKELYDIDLEDYVDLLDELTNRLRRIAKEHGTKALEIFDEKITFKELSIKR